MNWSRTNRYLPVALLMAACAVLLAVFYGGYLSAPDAWLFADTGDGLKNYYTFIYHIRYDHDPWEFGGMDHPYGEHVFFTDGHPWLSMVLMALRPVFPGLIEHGTAVLGLLLLLAIPACALVMFRLFRELGVRPWTAAACAFGITVLAPQADRLYGHLALSYSVFLPLTWLLLIKCLRVERWRKWCVLLGLSTIGWWGTHGYLGAMASAFGALFLLGYALVRWRGLVRAERMRLIAAFVAVAVLPVLVFQGALSLTDHHPGRSKHPSGFDGYNAEPDDVLLPSAPPLRPLLDDLTGGRIDHEWEAQAYVGLVTLVVLCAWPIVAWRRARRKLPRRRLPIEVNAAVWASLVLLIYAFCFPFKDFKQLIPLFPLFEQFRATGRFDWPFYFVITTTVVMVADGWVQRRYQAGRRWVAILVVAAMAVMWTWEGLSLHKQSRNITERPNLFRQEHQPEAMRALYDRLDPAPFQAILPMPYFNFGSESFSRPTAGHIVRAAITLSYRTGLPIAAGLLSRVSVPESKKLTQLVAPRYYPKPIEADLPDDRPFLLVRSDDPLTVLEEELVRDAQAFDSIPGLTFYRITKQALFRRMNAERWAAFEQLRPSLHPCAGFLVRDPQASFIHLDLDDSPSAITYRGPGAITVRKNGTHELIRMKLLGVPKDKRMIASVWMYNGYPEGLNLGLMLQVDQPKSGHIDQAMPDVSEVVQGDWTLVEVPFTTEKDRAEIVLRTQWKGYHDRPVTLDEVLVRPADLDVYRVEDAPDGKGRELFLNDHRIPEP